MNQEKTLQITFSKFDFIKIFKVFTIARSHNNLLIAFFAVVVLGFAGYLMDFTGSVAIEKTLSDQITLTELDVYIIDSASLDNFKKTNNSTGRGVFATIRDFTADRFNNMVIAVLDRRTSQIFVNIAHIGKAFIWAFVYHPFYSAIYLIIMLIVFSLAGGAISRIAALEISRGEKLGAFKALAYSRENFFNFLLAPILPLCLVAIPGIFILIIGLLGFIPYAGEILVSISLFAALFLGAIMTLVVIGALSGSSMMFPVIAYEGTDSFEVMSRLFSYVYTKPWHLTFYYIVALTYGSVCYIFVRFFAFITLSVVYLFLWLSARAESSIAGISKLKALWQGPSFLDLAGPQSTYNLTATESISAFIIKLAVYLVIALVAAFVFSFFFSANTVIYALMRKKVDGIEIGSIYHAQLETTTPEPEQ